MDESTRLVRSVGPWVSGDRFFNRAAELEAFLAHLEEGNSLLLLAMRRIGKTSLMHEAARRLDGRCTCLVVDLQACRTAGDAVVQLASAMWKVQPLQHKVRDTFRNVLESVQELSWEELTIKLQDATRTGWESKADRLFADLAGLDAPAVVFLDEVPILVARLLRGEGGDISEAGRRDADHFLHWLRGAVVRHARKVRFVVTGSIGLDGLVREAGLSATLNALTPFVLEPWSDGTGIACLRALARNYDLTLGEGVARRMVDRLGCCVPHHVQLFFSHVLDDARRRRATSVAVDDVDRVYEQSMLGARGHAELSHFEERLRLAAGSDFPLALDLLTEAASAGALGAPAAAALAKEHRADRVRLGALLLTLQHDGYLVHRGDAYVFLSSLLRDWWRLRFSFGYTPVAARTDA